MKKKQEQPTRNYQSSDYGKEDFTSQGLATTHEQVNDTLTEGTFDAKIDKVDENGQLISHQGEAIKKGKKRD
ncbi:Protein of unknown function [Halobacillus karajensis]|uniref:DUF4025 domain-containing protein n=1 Tax=Halobacillus karajensis TaxID=195088 RepID=A0A059NYI1_9BACI|nr:YozQ family protein [Halobacillus karajensis]CDQ19305.1 hypothetical protein BN982_01592 [Halobacillus karajensis]CDQ22532.1 hypothetical protein BN983_00745 [Halobacillus karajensis]CDQ26014.1 hypothetical protein BN981_00225 [Halobacillus karajensis]SEH38583.1 Protein of unknown function [Halobacillus karajensis]